MYWGRTSDGQDVVGAISISLGKDVSGAGGSGAGSRESQSLIISLKQVNEFLLLKVLSIYPRQDQYSRTQGYKSQPRGIDIQEQSWDLRALSMSL